jgi:hypothetical protein
MVGYLTLDQEVGDETLPRSWQQLGPKCREDSDGGIADRLKTADRKSACGNELTGGEQNVYKTDGQVRLRDALPYDVSGRDT